MEMRIKTNKNYKKKAEGKRRMRISGKPREILSQ